jgi:O-antigen ligase
VVVGVAVQIILMVLFIFAALSYGAVRPWAYPILFGATFLLCAVVFLQSGVSLLRNRRSGKDDGWTYFSAFRGPFVVFLAAFLVFTLFQLAPLPGSLLKELSPYSAYLYGKAHDLTFAADLNPGKDFTGYLSLDRDKTVKSLLATLAYLGFAFLTARSIRWSRDLGRLAILLIAFSLGLSLYGLLALLFTPPTTPGAEHAISAGARVSATLINPDHFASYLMMAIYLTFGYLAAFLKRSAPPAMGRTRVRRWLNALGAEGSHVPKAFLLLFVMAVMIFVMFYTLSRGAVIGLCLSLFFTFMLLFLKTRRPVFLLLMIPAAAFVAYYIQIVGADPLLERIEQTKREFLEFDDNMRTLAYRAGLELWERFPLFGCGLGCFQVVYQTMGLSIIEGWYLPYIHNDWLQMAIETGWVGGSLLVLAMGAVFIRIARRWWRSEEPWGFGFGLAALGAMVGMAVHAFLDFSLRIPVNAIFLMLMVSLALVALDEGFGGKMRGKKGGSLTVTRRRAAGLAQLSAAVVCLLLAFQVGRLGLAQVYCPTEMDTVTRREIEMSAPRLQKALALNPLNADYWLILETYLEAAEVSGIVEGTSAPADGPQIIPEDIPGWKKDRLAGRSLQEWAFAEALARSPASTASWVSWAEYLWGTVQSEAGGRESVLLQRAAQSYQMAVELYPGSSAVRRRSGEFFGWVRKHGGKL